MTTRRLYTNQGYTLIEIVLASLLLVFLVGVVAKYYSTADLSRGQAFQTKAVNTAMTAQMEAAVAVLKSLERQVGTLTEKVDEFVESQKQEKKE